MASWISKEEWKVFGRLNLALVRLLRGECSSARLIEKWARQIPDRPAVFFQDRALSYRELNALANRVAHHFLGLGARPGDLVALYMENCPEYLALIAGLNKIGVVASLINTHLRQHPLVHALTICSPRWIVASETLAPALQDVEDQSPLKR